MSTDLDLYYAAAWGQYDEVEDLLQESSCDVDFVNDERGGKTPLYIAASWVSANHLKTVETLLEYGANINLANNCKQSPLYVAASWGNPLAVSLLIQHKADVNQPNDQKRTPLHIASCPKPHLNEDNERNLGQYRDESTIELFNAAMVCMNQGLFNYSTYLENLENDYRQFSALNVSHWARIPDHIFLVVLYYNHFVVVTKLVEAGANVNAVDHLGQTPLDKAYIWGHGALIRYFEANGGVRGWHMSSMWEKPQM